MTREARTIFLAILTLTVYAVFIFIDEGAFIFPFPLNQFVFLAVSAQFLWWNRTVNLWAGILSAITGILGVLSTQFFWMFIYGPEDMMELTEGNTVDYLLLTFYTLILVGGIATLIRQKKGIAMIFSALFVLAFVPGVFLNNPFLVLLAYAFMVVSSQLSKVFVPYHLLWVLLFILKLMEWPTFFLND